MLQTLILGVLLTCFELDEILIQGINEVFNKNFSISVYWVIIVIIGAIVEIFRKN